MSGNQIKKTNKRRVLITLLIPLAMSLIAVSSVNVALASIGKGLQASDTQLQWVLSAYTLIVGLTLVPAGRLGDISSRRTMFLIGLVVFMSGSALSALAPNPLFLNAARVIQGIGAGIYSPQIMGIIQQNFTGPQRAKAFGLFGMVVSFSVAIGPVLSGGLISAFGVETGWRYIFFMNIPLSILGIIAGYLWLPHERKPNLANLSSNKLPLWVRLDMVGGTLLLLSIISLLIPFTTRTLNWYSLLMLAVSLGTLYLWIKWEACYMRLGREPMVDLKLLQIRSFSLGTATAAIYFMGATAMFVVMATFMQNDLGYAAIYAGVIGLPNALMAAVGSRWGSLRVTARGRQIVLLGLSVIMLGIFASILVFVAVIFFNQSIWWLLLTLGITGFGQGVFGSTNQTLAMEEIPRTAGGTAGGLKQTTERVGTAIGLATMTGLYFSTATTWSAGAGVIIVFAVAFVSVGLALCLAYFDFSRGRTAKAANLSGA